MIDEKHPVSGRNHFESTESFLEQAIADYLQWMTENGYKPGILKKCQRVLTQFNKFITQRGYTFDKAFTLRTLNTFKSIHEGSHTHIIRGLARHLFHQKKISAPIPRKEYSLPDIYEAYLLYRQKYYNTPYLKRKQIKRVLAAFHEFLTGINQELRTLEIDHIDAFHAQFNAAFAPGTQRLYRYYLRGFLSYLYHEKRWFKKDLASLVKGAPVYTMSKPPKFLRRREIAKVFDRPLPTSARDLRTYAMAHLAYFLGLRPQEITKIRLNDISFQKAELDLEDRKNDMPITLPMPDRVLKAITAYIIGGRPQSKSRRLFLTHFVPYGPLSTNRVSSDLSMYLRNVNVKATGYWLRHTYAQNLLQAGASLYDIKEMMGHDCIESSKHYLHIHTDMMRKVLFDEAL
jgi:integrase/recombinase XerD